MNFRNIPKTCGQCHERIYEGFRESAHFEHLASKDEENLGPNCVTCHGSINATVLNSCAILCASDYRPAGSKAVPILFRRLPLQEIVFRMIGSLRGGMAGMAFG